MSNFPFKEHRQQSLKSCCTYPSFDIRNKYGLRVAVHGNVSFSRMYHRETFSFTCNLNADAKIVRQFKMMNLHVLRRRPYLCEA